MSCPLVKFSNLFGKPNEGIHAYRILDIAIADVIATFIGAGVISYTFNINFIKVLIVLIIISIILHRLFCVNTTVNKWIFGEVVS